MERASFSRTRPRNVKFVVAGILLVLVLMVLVGGKSQIVRLGYQLDALEKERQELERTNRSLRIEASSLSSPGRIEEIAVKRIGLIRPSKDNIVIVKRTSGKKPHEQVPQ